MSSAANQAAAAADGPARLLAAQLANSDTGWSMGTFGAIAEFTRQADEAAAVATDASALSLVTARGGLRLTPPGDLRLIASESLTKESWSQRVALCLPEAASAMAQRQHLTEIGPDTDALRGADRDAVLFDLGLGCHQVDVCVRISDPQTARALRRAVGQPVFAPGSAALAVLMAAHPHRVFVTRLGRLEVFQPIPPPDGRSPDGPHTHILPKLLAAGRTHAATEPLPDGWVPCAHVYPAHPQRDQLGRAHAFAPHQHDAFQMLLERFGVPELTAQKRDVVQAIAAGRTPDAASQLGGRHGRATLRVALRQIQAAGRDTPILQQWLAAFDARAIDDPVDPMDQLH